MKSKPQDTCLIVCNGDIHRNTLNRFLKFNSYDKSIYIISTDGAANVLRKYRISPDIIIGDLDSVRPETLQYFKSQKIIVKKVINQNQNDLEKAILFAISKKFSEIFVMGFAGWRLDHTLNNLSVIRKYYRKCRITMIDAEFKMFFTDKDTEFDYTKGEIVSLFAFQKSSGIKTSGLKYLLSNESLEFGVRQGTLNSSKSKRVKIEIGKGVLLVFKKHFGNFSNL